MPSFDPVEVALLAGGQDEDAEARFGATTTRFKHASFVVLHLCWGVFTWIIIAYGLIFNLLGASAARDFTNSWGIGVGMSHAAVRCARCDLHGAARRAAHNRAGAPLARAQHELAGCACSSASCLLLRWL